MVSKFFGHGPRACQDWRKEIIKAQEEGKQRSCAMGKGACFCFFSRFEEQL